MNGLLAYLKELSPVTLGPGEENDRPYQDADGDLSGDPMAHEAEGVAEDQAEGGMEEGGLDLATLLAQLQGGGGDAAPFDPNAPIAKDGEEGFPTAPGMSGEDPKMALLAQQLMGGFNGPKLG